jgi:hypothetical protein
VILGPAYAALTYTSPRVARFGQLRRESVQRAEWESARVLGEAFRSPEFQRRIASYPESVVASPHLFKKVAVPGI